MRTRKGRTRNRHERPTGLGTLPRFTSDNCLDLTWTASYRPLVTASFQPNAGAPIDEMLTTKLPVDPKFPLTALEQANCAGLKPVCA